MTAAAATTAVDEMIELSRPTSKEIDALCAKYEAAQQEADEAAAVLKEKNSAAGKLKTMLIRLTEAFGDRHTEKSKRLVGIHSYSQTTTGTTTETVPSAVTEFKSYLDSSHSPTLIGRFFQAHTTYSLIAGPAEVLKSLELPARIRTKMEGLVARCFKIGTKSPSLKVETVKAAKP